MVERVGYGCRGVPWEGGPMDVLRGGGRVIMLFGPERRGCWGWR